MGFSRYFSFVLALFLAGNAAADWVYSSQLDRMSSKKNEFASLESNLSLRLKFPYSGKNHASLVIQKTPSRGTNVYFSIDEGQLMCRSYAPCQIKLRFDDRPAFFVSGSGPADGSSNTAFLSSTKKIIEQAKSAKKILVEFEVYGNGTQLVELQSSKPLVWK